MGVAPGCGLEEIEDGGNEDQIPADVQAAFDESCATSPACHGAGSAPQLSLDAGSSVAILTESAANGDPYVEFGNVEGSYIAQRILGLSDAQMPPSEQSPNDGRNTALIVGWIAGVEIDEGGSGGDGDGDGGMTCYVDTAMPTPTFETDLWPTVEARCAASTCHGGGAAPDMSDAATAHANLVDVASSAGMPYVTAGMPEESYLWHKIAGTQMAAGGGGATMPFGGSMCSIELQTVYAWILTGAPL